MNHRIWLLAAASAFGMLMVAGCAAWWGSSGMEAGNGAAQAAGSRPEISIFSFDRADYEHGDRVLEAIEQKTGTRIRILSGPWDDTQLDVLVATGDYPDVITIVDNENSGRFNKWIKEGILVPFDDALIDGLPHLQALFADPTYQNLKVNGKFYGLPLKVEYPPNSAAQHVVIMRKDWLDRLHLPVPQTLEQFKQTLEAFKNGDPDGDGSPDTYGLISDGLVSVARNLAGSWGLPIDERNTGFLQVGDHYEYWAIQPQLKDDLRYVKQLYDEKLIDPDTLSSNINVQIRPKFVEGRIGALYDSANFDELVKKRDQLNLSFPQAKLIELPALEGPANNWGYSVGTGYWGYTVITNKAKDPRAIARLFDFLLSDEGKNLTLFGVPGIHYTVEDGQYHLRLEERKKDAGFDPNHPGAPHELNYGIVEWSQMTGASYLQLRDLTDPGFSKTVFDNLHNINEHLVMPASMDITTPKWISFKANSDQLYQEYFNKMIMGQLDIDKGFDEFVQKWKESGGQDAMEEMSDAIKAERDQR